MERKAAKEVLHTRDWLGRVDPRARQGELPR